MLSRLLERLYRTALWLLPPRFRRAWGEAMIREARSTWREARARGRHVRASLALGDDLVRTVGSEWLDVLRVRRPWRGRGSGARWPDDILQDLRYAARQIVRAPLLSLVAILVLTVGIGTTAVVLSVIDGILFRGPPGVGELDGLVEVWSEPLGLGPSDLTYREFLALRDRRSVFEHVAAYRGTRVALRSGEGRTTVRAELASSAYFAALRLRMERGTGFDPADDRSSDGAAHAVLGYAYWRAAMGGSPDVVGRTVGVNGRPYTVVGVAPERFYGAGDGDDPVAIWLPAADHPLLFPDEEPLLTGDSRAFSLIARLAGDVTVARAEAVARAIRGGMEGSASATAGEERRRVEVTPYRGVGSRRATAAFAIVGLTGGLVGGLVLLIACANVSGLLLGRALGRRREIGVRLALGAARRRILRQLLTESVLLAAVAGAAGVTLTFATLDLLERTLFTFPVDLAPGLATLALTVGVTGAAGVAFGLLPALHATRASVDAAIRDDLTGLGRRRSRLRDGFAVAQLALSLPLLTAAGLLIVQLMSQTGGDGGLMDPDRVLTVRLDLAPTGYAAAEVEPLLARLGSRVRRLPGVSGAAFTSAVPFLGGSTSRIVRVPGPDGRPDVPRTLPIRVAVVDSGYFGTLGIPIVRGRPIRPADVPGAPLVVVVDEEVARRSWPGEDPLGRTLILLGRSDTVSARVVGVSARVGQRIRPSTTFVYASRRQLPDTTSMTLVVRTEGDAADLAPVIRSEVAALDRDLIADARVLSAVRRAGRTELAHGAAGAAACGLIALLLACVGLYGVIATGVTERTREIGVRIALGAHRSRIVGHFVRKGLGVTLLAVGLGIPLSWATVAVVGVGVSAFSSEVAVGLAGVTALMMAVAVVSSWLPARRSSSVDPVRALRSD